MEAVSAVKAQLSSLVRVFRRVQEVEEVEKEVLGSEQEVGRLRRLLNVMKRSLRLLIRWFVVNSVCGERCVCFRSFRFHRTKFRLNGAEIEPFAAW